MYRYRVRPHWSSRCLAAISSTTVLAPTYQSIAGPTRYLFHRRMLLQWDSRRSIIKVVRRTLYISYESLVSDQLFSIIILILQRVITSQATAHMVGFLVIPPPSRHISPDPNRWTQHHLSPMLFRHNSLVSTAVSITHLYILLHLPRRHSRRTVASSQCIDSSSSSQMLASAIQPTTAPS